MLLLVWEVILGQDLYQIYCCIYKDKLPEQFPLEEEEKWYLPSDGVVTATTEHQLLVRVWNRFGFVNVGGWWWFLKNHRLHLCLSASSSSPSKWISLHLQLILFLDLIFLYNVFDLIRHVTFEGRDIIWGCRGYNKTSLLEIWNSH